MKLFLDAFLLALSSSTDNFMVGLSVGISNQSLSFGANALISICNAAGALLASFGGGALGQNLPPHLPPLLSSLAFAGLALKEFLEFWRSLRRKRILLLKKKEKCHSDEKICDVEDICGGDGTSHNTKLNISRAVHLAIPMTLNNLASGVAGEYTKKFVQPQRIWSIDFLRCVWSNSLFCWFAIYHWDPCHRWRYWCFSFASWNLRTIGFVSDHGTGAFYWTILCKVIDCQLDNQAENQIHRWGKFMEFYIQPMPSNNWSVFCEW